MLTLESKFSEFIELCRKAGACADAGEAIPVMEAANKGEGMPADGTCADGFKLYLESEKFPESWASWVLNVVGKEMDDKCRQFFIGKITSPKIALTLMQISKIFTEEEITLLKAVYIGKLTSTDIKEPMDAFRLYIDCAPILTETDSLSLKAVFEGKLPVAEKELRDGIVTRVTAEVAP